MNGVADYPDLFKTGQYGRFYFVSSSHARGKTFEIYILPKGEEAIGNGEGNGPLNKDAVKVFGELPGGQPGWTESYGWLHNGKWIVDFHNLCRERRKELREEKEQNMAVWFDAEKAKEAKEKILLEEYEKED